MEVSGLYAKLFQIKPRKATKEEILLFHTENHFEHIKSLNKSISVNAGISAPTGIGSFDIALLSTGGVIEAIESEVEGWLAIATQFHPEADSASALDAKIFEEFVVGITGEVPAMRLVA